VLMQHQVVRQLSEGSWPGSAHVLHAARPCLHEHHFRHPLVLGFSQSCSCLLRWLGMLILAAPTGTFAAWARCRPFPHDAVVHVVVAWAVGGLMSYLSEW
jgi:hypothetical protein